MSGQHNAQPEPVHHPIYHIRVDGHLAMHWADVFDGLTITLEESGNTLLSGPVVDQAALYGALRRIRDAGMTLVSIERL